ncbi:MAG: MiaB/RimO family radical SAM methylthiotransferase [Planctomycetota bacterium]|jgi:ribosomal protein S12 methylthiotransferase
MSKETTRPAIGLISLGCAKNLVDSERLLGRLGGAGFPVCLHPDFADVLLVNTCGFLREAEEESCEILDRCLERKADGDCRAVVALGCLPARWGREGRLEGLDGWFGVGEIEAIVAFLASLDGSVEQAVTRPPSPPAGLPVEGARFRLTPGHWAYLRITEGCDNRCRYCTIPAIRGPLRSKPLESIVEEASELAASGAREIVVVGQDTAAWQGEGGLGAVLQALSRVRGVEWIRVMYAHPAHVDRGVVDALAAGGPVLPYLDLPVQHGAAPILRAMGRLTTPDDLKRLITRLRERIPGLVLRTTVMVGFPGEDEAAFLELLRFVSWAGFERLGAFLYSAEPDTAAVELPRHVRMKTGRRRLEEVLTLAGRIRDAAHRRRVGGEEAGVSEGADGDWTLVRTPAEAPEVDPMVWVPGSIAAGARGRVRITGVQGPDLVGHWLGARRGGEV